MALARPGATYVSGGPGSGKSAAAQAIAAAAGEAGRHSLLVAAPAGAADAGVLALAGVARRLGGNVAAHGGWSKLRSRTSKLLWEQREEVVLVIDEPSSWMAAGGMFARRAEEAAETLFGPGTVWPVVVCDQGAAAQAVALPSFGREDLTDAEWGPLGEAALKLSAMPIASQLHTPLQQRLAAAIVAWDREPKHEDAHRLASHLAETLVLRRHGRPLWALWQRLALARTPLDIEILNALGAARLSSLATTTLHAALLDGAGRLHDVLRAIPEDRPPDPELAAGHRRGAHELLFEHHYARFEEQANADEPGAADAAAEALFHAGELEDDTRLGLVNIDLVEQFDALGHRLGVTHGDHRGAVTAYRRALLADPYDAYATHHLAFHLDAQGLDAMEVDAGYARAVKIDPGQAMWHARRVAFLVDTARPAAARVAWAQVESALSDDRGDPELYATLHVPVAASLLAAGELSFCDYVLGGVPVRARTAQHRELSRLLTGRLAGQDRGAFVPSPRSGGTWWKDPPARLPARDTDGRGLVSWLAGRLEAVDASGVELHVARVDAAAGPHGIGLLRLSFDDLADRLLDEIDPRALTAGRFLEIGRYRDQSLEDRTGIVVLAPEALLLPVDVLPASRWQVDAPHAPADG